MGQVYVFVHCNCKFGKEWLYFPRGIIGWHKVDDSDPRSKMGAKWANDHTQCNGHIFSSACDPNICYPMGIVVAIVPETSKSVSKINFDAKKVEDMFLSQ